MKDISSTSQTPRSLRESLTLTAVLAFVILFPPPGSAPVLTAAPSPASVSVPEGEKAVKVTLVLVWASARKEAEVSKRLESYRKLLERCAKKKFNSFVAEGKEQTSDIPEAKEGEFRLTKRYDLKLTPGRKDGKRRLKLRLYDKKKKKAGPVSYVRCDKPSAILTPERRQKDGRDEQLIVLLIYKPLKDE